MTYDYHFILAQEALKHSLIVIVVYVSRKLEEKMCQKCMKKLTE